MKNRKLSAGVAIIVLVLAVVLIMAGVLGKMEDDTTIRVASMKGPTSIGMV